MSGERWPLGSLAEEIARIVHAFPDKGRKDDVRALADRVADLERAAETTRAEHAAALKRAEGAERVASMGRTLVEGARESEHMARAALEQSQDALGLATARIRELEGERDELLGLVKRWAAGGLVVPLSYETDAIVSRIEKATKGGTTP